MRNSRGITAFVMLFVALVPVTAQRVGPVVPARGPQGLQTVDDKFDPARFSEWVKAVTTHQAGVLDEAATTCAAVSPAQLDQTVDDFIRLLELERKTRANPDPTAITVYKGQSFVLPALDALLGLTEDEGARGDANRIIKRAAILHTDIARFARNVPTETVRTEGFGQRAAGASTVKVNDGNATSTETVSPHWDLARRLLDVVTPSPSADVTVRQWYEAVVALDVARARWGTAAPNLSKARSLLPNDARIAFYSGVLHETMASPDIQNAVLAMREKNAADLLAGRKFTAISPGSVQSEDMELLAAERFFRQALTNDPAFWEAHLRLGYVLDRMGRYDDAAGELRKAASELPDLQLQYYVALFLGRAEAALGQSDDAHRQFERASTLYPTAQAPLLADSQLSRSEDNPPRALASLQRLLSLPAGNERDDPWWTYAVAAARDADDLTVALYRPFLTTAAR